MQRPIKGKPLMKEINAMGNIWSMSAQKFKFSRRIRVCGVWALFYRRTRELVRFLKSLLIDPHSSIVHKYPDPDIHTNWMRQSNDKWIDRNQRAIPIRQYNLALTLWGLGNLCCSRRGDIDPLIERVGQLIALEGWEKKTYFALWSQCCPFPFPASSWRSSWKDSLHYDQPSPTFPWT